MDHSDTHCRYVANVKFFTYDSYGGNGLDGSYIFYGMWSSFSNFANGSHINGASLQNHYTHVYTFVI